LEALARTVAALLGTGGQLFFLESQPPIARLAQLFQSTDGLNPGCCAKVHLAARLVHSLFQQPSQPIAVILDRSASRRQFIAPRAVLDTISR
jgi:hypothetical protein